jgi:hypothetical protein
MISLNLYLMVAAASLLAIGQIIDWYSYYIKRSFLIQKSPSVMSVANWIQYFGRIFCMVSTFLISFMFESGLNESNLDKLYISSLSLSGLVIIAATRYRFISNLPYIFQRSACLKFFGEAGKASYWTKINKIKFDKLFFCSLFVNFAMISALVLPIFAAAIIPAYRMTFVYCGQFLNFVSSIVIFAYIDRILYRDKLEISHIHNDMSSVLWGKVSASILMPGLMIGFLLCTR